MRSAWPARLETLLAAFSFVETRELATLRGIANRMHLAADVCSQA